MEESFAAQIIAYHEASKHHYRTYAPGPGYLDWATQPDPFRRYTGAQVIPLARPAPDDDLPYEAGFMPGLAPVAPLDAASVSRLFFDTLAISAWKEYGDERWALRVNPSSGNLHPTEGYLICGALPGLSDAPIVAHYAPAEHSLEVRARLTPHIWQALREGVVLNRGDGLPEETIFVGLTSILWREAWKYGDRAFRYCQHDVGHALGALGIAAAGLGWQARLLDDLGADQVETLLGVADPRGAEPEHPDCLVAVFPQSARFQQWKLPEASSTSSAPSRGRASRTSSARATSSGAGPRRRRRSWGSRRAGAGDRGQETADSGSGDRASRDHAGQAIRSPGNIRFIAPHHPPAAERAGDGRADGDRAGCVLPDAAAHDAAARGCAVRHAALAAARPPGDLRPPRDRVDAGPLPAGARPGQTEALRAALKPEFAWESTPGCPPELPLYRLASGDTRGLARRISCGQDIAADGCFSLGMLAEFERPLTEHGAWVYPRLFWECGMIGQVLYLEAEAAGLRGTGIGCFFDDGMHSLLGLKDRRYQSLYHFTVGGPLEDERLTTLPAYT